MMAKIPDAALVATATHIPTPQPGSEYIAKVAASAAAMPTTTIITTNARAATSVDGSSRPP